MGTGKSTVGKILAKKLKMGYVNTDEIIEEKEKKKISQIFEEDGEDYFRKKEREVIKDISKDNHQVIDLGGGAIIKEENLKDLRKNGLIICLTASLEEIMKRTEEEERPLLKIKSSKLKVKRNSQVLLLGLSLSIFAFFVHSFGDFDLYNPSLTTITFFILALAVVRLKENHRYCVRNSVLTKIVLLLIMVIVIFLGGMNFREILAGRKAKQSVELINKNRFSEGRAMLQRALSYQPDNPAYWYKLSAIDQHHAFGQKDSSALKKAIESMQKAIALNPDPAYYHYKLSTLLV